jgi:Ca2+ transporting ATPase
MEIPADGYVVESAELTVDESAMTGETDPIKIAVLEKCIKRRNQIIEEGGKNTVGAHDVFTPILMSGTKVKFRFFLLIS